MILIKLGRMKGNCKVPKFKDYITVNGVSWQVDSDDSESDSVDTDPRSRLPFVTVNKTVDISSCDFMKFSAGRSRAQSVGTVEIKFLMQHDIDKDPLVYLEFKLDGAFVTSWGFDGNEDQHPTETVTIKYQKIWMQYTPFDGGRPGTPASRGWDCVQNRNWDG